MAGAGLTETSFNKMLDCLAPLREEAGAKYEKIRNGLIKYFYWQNCLNPEDLADETINRVARALEEGKEIRTSDPVHYFRGVARNVAREQWDKKVPEQLPEDEQFTAETKKPFEDEERKVVDKSYACLDRCAQTLSAENKELILTYYEGEKGTKISNRKDMCDKLGIPVNALRIRALRIRKELANCVKDCVSK
jgi:DNA-directed RNA polymerase specialized sigma24 family protein